MDELRSASSLRMSGGRPLKPEFKQLQTAANVRDDVARQWSGNHFLSLTDKQLELVKMQTSHSMQATSSRRRIGRLMSRSQI